MGIKVGIHGTMHNKCKFQLNTILSVFFTGEILREGEFFLPLAYFWQNLDPRKTLLSPKIHPFWPFFIHLNPFSSTFKAFIQHLDELALGYVLVVPPRQKTKNHRKNIDNTRLHLESCLSIWLISKLTRFMLWTLNSKFLFWTSIINRLRWRKNWDLLIPKIS